MSTDYDDGSDYKDAGSDGSGDGDSIYGEEYEDNFDDGLCTGISIADINSADSASFDYETILDVSNRESFNIIHGKHVIVRNTFFSGA